MRRDCFIALLGLASVACNAPPDDDAGAGGFENPGGSITSGGFHGGTSTSSGGFVAAKHRAWPTLPKTGNGVIQSPRVVLILPQNLGASEVAAYKALSLQLPASSWFSAWAPGYGISAARPSKTIVSAPVSSGTTFDAVSAAGYVDAAIASEGAAFVPDAKSVYLVMLPVGASISNTGSAVSGHHWPYGTDGAGLAIVAADQSGASSLGERTAVASHEVAEAITNTGAGYQLSVNSGQMPWTHSVWSVWEGINSAGGYIENGDFCEGDRFTKSAVVYQRIYDNAAAALHGDPCVPALPVPYFNVSTDEDWYPGSVGGTVHIPFNGWSTSAVDDIYLSVELAAENTNNAYTFKVEGRTATISGKTRSVINNGESAKLSVTIPASAKAGDWVVVSFWTWHADSAGNTPLGEDSSHLFAVGVYVP